MKKKIMASILVAALALGAIAVSAACTPNYVNTGGNYKEATATEVRELTTELDTQMAGTYNVYYLMDVSGNGESARMELDGKMSYGDGDTKINISYVVESSSDNIDINMDAHIYSDGEYMYISEGDNKIKFPVSFTGGTSIPDLGYDDLLPALSDDYDYAVAESGDTTKIKVTLDINDATEGIIKPGLDMPVELYLIIDGDKLTAMAMKCDGSVTQDGETVKVKIDIQVSATNGDVSLPGDLGEYTEEGTFSIL